MVTPLALVGGGEVRTLPEPTLCQRLHFLLTHASPASGDPFTVRAALGPARPTLYTLSLTHNMTTSCPDPSQRPGPAAYWSSPPFGPHIPQTPQSVRNRALHPTNLLLLQHSLLSKGTTTYQVMHTPPSITFFYAPPQSTHPPLTATTLGPAPSPPSLLLHFSPLSVLILIRGTCKRYLIWEKKVFAAVIQLGISRWGDYPERSGWALRESQVSF